MPDVNEALDVAHQKMAAAEAVGRGSLLGSGAMQSPQLDRNYELQRLAQQQHAMNLHRVQNEAPLRLRCLELALQDMVDDPLKAAATYWDFVKGDASAA